MVGNAQDFLYRKFFKFDTGPKSSSFALFCVISYRFRP